MRALASLFLVAALAACGGRKTPPAAPTPEALGNELATYPQVLVPLSPQTIENVRLASELRGAEKLRPGDFEPVYEHQTARIDGSTVSVLTAYSGAWLIPLDQPARPMTPSQFLHTLDADVNCRLAALTTPKGTLFIAREQVLDVLIALKRRGAASEDLPFSVIRGAAPRRR